jgi:hypothetical protein
MALRGFQDRLERMEKKDPRVLQGRPDQGAFQGNVGSKGTPSVVFLSHVLEEP